jgi:hypothetical protein
MVLPVPAEPPTRGTIVIALNELALGRVQEDGPLFPGEFERAFEFFEVADDVEAPLGIGVIKGVRRYGRRSDLGWCFGQTAGRQVEQGFSGFLGQMIDKFEKRIFIGCLTNVGKPFERDAKSEELIAGNARKKELKVSAIRNSI